MPPPQNIKSNSHKIKVSSSKGDILTDVRAKIARLLEDVPDDAMVVFSGGIEIVGLV